MSEYIEFGVALARQAGALMQSERLSGNVDVQRKPDGTFITNVDLAIQHLVIEKIRHRYPGHTIIGEEDSYGSTTADHIWHVDPLDGTGQYIAGDDPQALAYGFGLAKEYQGTLEAGLFFSPPRGELYTAVAGLGAFLNGQRIHVNDSSFEHGVPYDYAYWRGAAFDPHVLKSKLGPPMHYHAAIYQSCMVARGKSAFSVFPGSTRHDMTPGTILVTEAGGSVSDMDGQLHDWRETSHGAVFSNGVVHQLVLKALASS